jgi:hypothetical protein
MTESKPANCKTCSRFPVCKFVDANRELAKTNKMFGMFEYLEWNNLEELFYSNAGKCKYYVHESQNTDTLMSRINGAFYGFDWLKKYLTKKEGDNTFSFENKIPHALNAIDKYIEALKIKTDD